MKYRTPLIGVASGLCALSIAIIAPLSASAFWDGFPFGSPQGSPSEERESKLPFAFCERTISAAGISIKVNLPSKKCDPIPPPVDECPNVPGTQTSLPCADEECEEDGGTWDGNSCEFPSPDEPTLDFSADPTAIQQGASSTLEWDSTDADSCVASGGWSGSKPVDGSEVVTPNATTTYTLECEGEGGEVIESVTVNVSLAPAPPAPTLDFAASTSTIAQGATSTLEWESFNADSCIASGGWSGTKTLTGSQDVTPTATTTYTLTCENDEGDEVVKNVTVNVILPPEEPEPEGKLLITEVYYDVNLEGEVEPGQNEWVEIRNGTNAAVDLSGYFLRDGSTQIDRIPDGTILAAGQYLIVTSTTTTETIWDIPDEAVVLVLPSAIGNGLANGADRVFITNPASTTLDLVAWGEEGDTIDGFGEVVPSVAPGHSIAREPVEADVGTNADWVDRTTPTPGE